MHWVSLNLKVLFYLFIYVKSDLIDLLNFYLVLAHMILSPSTVGLSAQL